MVDHRLSRERFAVRLFEQIYRGHERYDQDGLVHCYRAGASSHGDRRYSREARHCSQGSQVEEHPCENEWHMRDW